MKTKISTGFFQIILITLVILIAGCASSGKEMSQANLDKIIVGTTTKNQMIQMFGSPLSQSYGTEGKLSMIWYYVYVGPFGTGMQNQNLAVLFDQNEIVEKYNIVDTRNSGATPNK